MDSVVEAFGGEDEMNLALTILMGLMAVVTGQPALMLVLDDDDDLDDDLED
jgi:hypothetical protein